MTLDTNILIAHLDGDSLITQALSDWKSEGRILFLPAVVETEILSFPKINPGERIKIEQLLDSLTFISYDRPIARLTAAIRRSTNIKLPDAAIAATGLATHSPVITRNSRDFQKVPNLMVITI